MQLVCARRGVAPLVGAWIETPWSCCLASRCAVAPLVGAWIETRSRSSGYWCRPVAPLVGAWIETSTCQSPLASSSQSHPSWVRGLKQFLNIDVKGGILSHPSWVRGLKQEYSTQNSKQNQVAPLVGAWIETRSPRTCRRGYPVAPLVGAWIETSPTRSLTRRR